MGDVSLVLAFAVGLASFLSPCVLPLVPGYLSTVSGVTFSQLGDAERSIHLRVIKSALLFSLSFSVMFIALGATASSLGNLLQDNRILLNKVAGVVVIAMGAFLIAASYVTRLNRDWHPQRLIERAGSGGPLITGAAFAFAWTPCIGPTLAAILSSAATQQDVGEGAALLAAYSAGLAVPFILSALAFNYAVRSIKFFQRHYQVINFSAGLILIAMGALIFTNEMFQLNVAIQRLLDELGINFFRDI